MPDIVDPATRSRMMSGIRSAHTKPEMVVRRGLHARGFRFRLHSGKVPGKPDLVLPKYRAAIFVHGCFWHGHDCSLFRLPATRTAFWRDKIDRNRTRDQKVRALVEEAGWRCLSVWECAFRGPGQVGEEEMLRQAATWIEGGQRTGEIRGTR